MINLIRSLKGYFEAAAVTVLMLITAAAGWRLYASVFPPPYAQGWIVHGQLPEISKNEADARKIANQAGVGLYNSGVMKTASLHPPRFAKRFVPVGNAEIDGNTSVIGVCGKDECKAYDVGWVMSLQIINDTLGKQKIAVTG